MEFLACTGTSSILTDWPGNEGQNDVLGSLGSWNSVVPLSRYCEV